MAGVDDAAAGSASADFVAHSGPFNQLARAQYRALAAMRWSIFRNSLRTTRGALELGSRVVTYLVYSGMSFGMFMGFGSAAYFLTRNGKWELLPIFFWALFTIWQVVPVSMASFQEQFDLGGLLRFPVGFGAFYVLHLVFGMVDVSTILGGFGCLGIFAGATLARPGLSGWVALAVVVFAAFNVLLVRAIFAWIDRWLAQRRTREIVGALFFLALISVQLLNPAFHPQTGPGLSPKARAAAIRRLEAANAVQRWFPPGLAALEIERAAEARPAPALGAVILLGVYALAMAGVLGMRLRAEYRGENLSDAPARKKVERRGRSWLIDGSGPIAAVMEKELRTLLRALPLIYGLGAPMLMVFLFSGVFARRGHGAAGPPSIALLLCLGYALVGFTQFFYNNLGPEGPGIQLLFLAPTPIRTVMLAKNLFHALLFLIDGAIVCVVAGFRMGWLPPAALAATCAWLAFALPVHLAAGNAFSLTMPYRMNLGRITRQRGSQASALLSMLIQAAVLGLGAGVIALCSFLGALWVATPMFLILAVGAVIAWLRLLANVDAMANQRRESLVGALAKAE